MPDPTMFQIPPESVWAAVGGGLVLLLTCLWYLERRQHRQELALSRMLTREEHDKICEKNQQAISSDLTVIKTMLTEQDRKALEHREKVEDSLGTIKTDVAVLQSRMNESVEVLRIRRKRT